MLGGLEGLVDPARDGEVGVNPASAEGADDFLAELAQVDCFERQLRVGAEIRPMTLRVAGSASKPRSRSGPASSKKCMPWLWMIWPMCISSRSSEAGRGGVAPVSSSLALPRRDDG